MSPKKIGDKKGYPSPSNSEQDENTPDVSSDEMIARLIAEMENLNVSEAAKKSIDDLATQIKGIQKKWKHRNDKTKEEKEQEQKEKKIARANEKKEKNARERGEVIALHITNIDGSTITLNVVRGITVGTLRLMIAQTLGLSRAKALRLHLTWNSDLITSQPRKTLRGMGISNNANITIQVHQASVAAGSADVPLIHLGDGAETASSMSQEDLDFLVARDLVEGDEMDDAEESDTDEGEMPVDDGEYHHKSRDGK